MIKHLACIMDGNRRWAKKHGWLPWDGHKEGVKTAQRVVDFCLQQSIPYLSLYTFSHENFRRPPEEQHFLFNILFKEIRKTMIDELQRKKVRVSFVGDRSLFPTSVRQECDEIEALTASADALQVNLLFCYGGRQEIVAGIKKIINEVQQGNVTASELTDTVVENYLWTAGIPAPDLIVRTGGVQRLSNFLLFQAAYSEFFFLDCLWPELTHAHLANVMESFETRQRNFGT
jgi:undecaprenyl diphosphate synthase